MSRVLAVGVGGQVNAYKCGPYYKLPPMTLTKSSHLYFVRNPFGRLPAEDKGSTHAVPGGGVSMCVCVCRNPVVRIWVRRKMYEIFPVDRPESSEWRRA